MYIPHPIDTSGVHFPPELKELSEMIAENTHEVWASARMAEGWHYGKKRDDKYLTTPCMVPYGDLPESEKEYDRKTSVETIKLVLALGFKISR